MKALMHGGHGQRDDPVRVGELQVWELVNDTGSDHPFHLHGFFFQVLDVDGEPPPWSHGTTGQVPKKRGCRSLGFDIGPASGCITATSSSTTRWG